QQRAYAGNQDSRAEGLCQEVIGAEPQRADHVLFLAAHGEHDQRRLAALPNLLCQFEAVHVRHVDVDAPSLRASWRRPRNGTSSTEHLARYVARPPVSAERLSLTEGGLVRCALKRKPQ